MKYRIKQCYRVTPTSIRFQPKNVEFGTTEALSEIVSALSEAGEIKQALEISQTFEDEGVKASALSSIASAQVEAGNKEQALATLKQALEVAQELKNAGLLDNSIELWDIAEVLVTEPIPENKRGALFLPTVGRMKKTFTSEEKTWPSSLWN